MTVEFLFIIQLLFFPVSAVGSYQESDRLEAIPDLDKRHALIAADRPVFILNNLTPFHFKWPLLRNHSSAVYLVNFNLSIFLLIK